MISMKASENSSEQFSLSFAKNLNSPTKMKLKLSLSWISKTKISQWWRLCGGVWSCSEPNNEHLPPDLVYMLYSADFCRSHFHFLFIFFSFTLVAVQWEEKGQTWKAFYKRVFDAAHSTSRRRVKQTRLSEALKVYFRKKKQNQKKTERRKKMCRVGFRWKKCEISSIIFSNARTTNSTWITVSNYVNETSNSSLLGQREWIKIEKKSFRVY